MTKPKYKTTPPDDLRQALIAALKERQGESVTAHTMSKLVGTGDSAVRHVLEELVSSGLLRQVKISRYSYGYYMPTERQLQGEASTREMASSFRPLRPRTAHQEAVDRAREVREQYRSVG